MDQPKTHQAHFKLGDTEYNIPVVLVEIYPDNEIDYLHFQATKRNVIPINEGPTVFTEIVSRHRCEPRPPFSQSATIMVDEVTLTSEDSPRPITLRNVEIFITESWTTITDVDSCGTRVWYFVRRGTDMTLEGKVENQLRTKEGEIMKSTPETVDFGTTEHLEEFLALRQLLKEAACRIVKRGKQSPDPDCAIKSLRENFISSLDDYLEDVKNKELDQETPSDDFITTAFSYHAPNQSQIEKYSAIRSQAKDLAEMIMRLCPDSSDRDMAIAKVREAVMWANVSIACNEK